MHHHNITVVGSASPPCACRRTLPFPALAPAFVGPVVIPAHTVTAVLSHFLALVSSLHGLPPSPSSPVTTTRGRPPLLRLLHYYPRPYPKTLIGFVKQNTNKTRKGYERRFTLDRNGVPARIRLEITVKPPPSGRLSPPLRVPFLPSCTPRADMALGLCLGDLNTSRTYIQVLVYPSFLVSTSNCALTANRFLYGS
ncbi:hypothetical protein L1987_28189 [Smallanthus sonchifolius]|uniref:Uncharacterized protein n=1 Tax=Smallanthus sonchifolius TaxID=185202 RepID=A0ACB9ID85_9ASTR|nr:hypothetical protein L1987_28189 [Smallanthus sonchifolius]